MWIKAILWTLCCFTVVLSKAKAKNLDKEITMDPVNDGEPNQILEYSGDDEDYYKDDNDDDEDYYYEDDYEGSGDLEKEFDKNWVDVKFATENKSTTTSSTTTTTTTKTTTSSSDFHFEETTEEKKSNEEILYEYYNEYYEEDKEDQDDDDDNEIKIDEQVEDELQENHPEIIEPVEEAEGPPFFKLSYLYILVVSAFSSFCLTILVFLLCSRSSSSQDKNKMPFVVSTSPKVTTQYKRYNSSPIVKNYQKVPTSTKDFLHSDFHSSATVEMVKGSSEKPLLPQ